MVVAAGTPDGQPEERRADAVDHLQEPLLPQHVLVEVPADHVNRPAAVHPRGDPQLRRLTGVLPRRQLVAGDLLNDEPVIRLVRVETLDDVVAVAPGLRPFGVQFESVALGEADHIEPVLRLPLPEVRRGEQPVHQLLVGVGCGVLQKRLDLGRGGRQPGQIERHPADEREPVRLGGELQALFLQPRGGEGVDRVGDRLAPFSGSAGRTGGLNDQNSRSARVMSGSLYLSCAAGQPARSSSPRSVEGMMKRAMRNPAAGREGCYHPTQSEGPSASQPTKMP